MSKRSVSRCKRGRHLKHRPDGYPNSVRLMRLYRQMTLQDVADKIGVTPQAIHRLEVLGQGLDTPYLLDLADVFQCHLRDLLTPVATLPDFAD